MDTNVHSGLVGTKTEKNLQTALTNESKAYTKYNLYGARADDDGYHTLGNTMRDIANQEKEHAEIFMEYLDGIRDTKSNVENMLEGENYENRSLYPEFARIAKEEGFDEIGRKFEMIGEIESSHSNLLADILTALDNDTLYTSDKERNYVCTNCGYRSFGKDAPERCPVCSYPQGYFRKEN